MLSSPVVLPSMLTIQDEDRANSRPLKGRTRTATLTEDIASSLLNNQSRLYHTPHVGYLLSAVSIVRTVWPGCRRTFRFAD